MAASVRRLIEAAALGSACLLGSALAADESDLVAPVYPGAVPAVLAEGVQAPPERIGTFGGIRALNCRADRGGDFVGTWCFLSRDPIDKVKAFYDQAVAPMRPIQGENGERGFIVFVERAWYPGDGGYPPAFGYSSVSMHALAPPRPCCTPTNPSPGGNGFPGQEAYQFYAESRHFGGFLDGVDWFGDPTKRRREELDAVYRERSHLEPALFQVRGPEFETVGATLRRQYAALRSERQAAAQIAPISALTQRSQTRTADAGPTAEEDAEFNRVMQQNPGLANEYVTLTQQVGSLMAQGKFDEADALLERIDELEQSNPELASLANQQQARSASISAAAQGQEDDIMAAMGRQMDEAIWGTATQYLDAIEPEAYYTLIVIDNALTGYERDYSRDRAVVEPETAGRVEQADLGFWGIRYRDPTPAGVDVPASSRQPAAEPEPAEPEEGRVRRGLRGLRGVLGQ